MALRVVETGVCVCTGRMVSVLLATRKCAVLGSTTLILGLLASTGAHAQCSDTTPNFAPPIVGTVGDVLPFSQGGSVNALVSVIDTANTAFLAGTTAFVGSPPSPRADQQGGGVWARAIGGTVDNDNTGVTTFAFTKPVALDINGEKVCDTTTRQDFAGFQVGRDIGQLNLGNSGVNLHVGLTAGYFEADAKDITPGGTFRGNFQVPFAGTYAVLTKGNFFADGQIRWDFFDNEVSDIGNGLFSQKFDARSLSVTANLGYRVDIPSKDGSKWFVEPSVGGVWSRTEVDPLNVSGTIFAGLGIAVPGTVQIDDVESKLGRASLRVGTNFVSGNVAWQPFAAASVFHEFAGKVTTTQQTDFTAVCNIINDPTLCPFPVDLKGTLATSRVGTYGQFGLGIAGQVIDTGWLGYARVDYRTGDNIEGVSGNIGLRYQFVPPGLARASLKDDYAPDTRGPYNWTGLYVGGFAGATWGDEEWHFVTLGTKVEPDFQGYLLGGQVGYNYQVGPWVLGIEGDIGTSNAEGGKSCPGPDAFFLTCEAEVDNLASVTGRLGYAWERALFYVKAGLAVGDVTVSESVNGGLVFPGFAATGATERQTGWTVGAGAEFAITDNWSAKGEWMYFDLGSERHVVANSAVIGPILVDATTRGEAVRVGVNYHFGH